MSVPSILIAAFCLVGLCIMGFGVKCVLDARASSSWPSTHGTIIQSEVTTSTDSDGTTYSPVVRYSYVAQGQTFQSNNVGVGVAKLSGGPDFAQSVTSKYRLGTPVTVYYDPAKPSNGALVKGLTKQSFILLAFGLGFVLLGSWIGLLFWLFT